MSYLRITGRPKIERDTNGLRKITRTYVAQGDASNRDSIEQEVFIPFGSPDVEYDATTTQDLKDLGNQETGAYLVAQSIAPGGSVNEVMVTRVYQELDASSDPVQVGGDEISVNGEDRLSLKRTFIVKNPYAAHYASGRVGVDSVIVDDGTANGAECILGQVQSKETEVYTEFIEMYYEDGVLSEKIDYRYGQNPNHKLEVRTLRGVAKPPPPPSSEGPGTGPWFEVESSEGPGNTDFGQAGKVVYTVKYAKGYGKISEKSEIKGKPPNTVEVKTIVFLTGENGTVPASEIPNFTRETFRSVEEKDGYEMHVIRGVDVSNSTGVVDAQVSYKYGDEGNHKLELIQAVSYGQAATIQNVVDFVYPAGDPYPALGSFVIIAEAEDTKGEFDVFRNTIVRGEGLIGESTKKVGLTEVSEQVFIKPTGTTIGTALGANELTRKVDQKDGYEIVSITTTTQLNGLVDEKEDTKNNGALSIISRVQLGSTWDAANTPAGYIEISERNHNYQIYPAITKVFAKGLGTVSESSKKVGLTTVTETASLHPPSPILPSEIQGDELSRNVKQEDGYQLLRVTETTQDSGIVDEKVEYRHNGALEIHTLMQLGSTWDAINTPAGFVNISTRNHRYDTFPAITKVFASGAGQILVASKESALFTIETYVQLGGTAPANAVDVSTSEEHGYVKITYSLKVLNDPATENEAMRVSNGLIIETASSLNNNDWSTGEIAGSKKYIDSENFIGEETDVKPDPSFSEASYMPGAAFVKKVTEVSVEEGAGTADPGTGLYASYNHLAPNIYKKTTVRYENDFDGPSVEISRKVTERTGYTVTEITSLGAPILGPGFVAREDESTDQYGIQRFTTVTVEPVAESFNLESSKSIAVPTVLQITDAGLVVKQGYTRSVAANIYVTYTTSPASGSFVYTPPSATVSFYVSFVDDLEPYDVTRGGPNCIYEYQTGASGNFTSFEGKSVLYSDISVSGSNSMPQPGFVLGFNSKPVLYNKNGAIYENELVTLAQTIT